MSTISGLRALPSMAGPSLTARAGATLLRWWVAYMTWRVERAAIAHLAAMTDRQLKDIGVSRSDIVVAVRGARAAPTPWYYRY